MLRNSIYVLGAILEQFYWCNSFQHNWIKRKLWFWKKAVIAQLVHQEITGSNLAMGVSFSSFLQFFLLFAKAALNWDSLIVSCHNAEPLYAQSMQKSYNIYTSFENSIIKITIILGVGDTSVPLCKSLLQKRNFVQQRLGVMAFRF